MCYYYLPKTKIDWIAFGLVMVVEQAQIVLSPQNTALAILLVTTF